VQGVLATGTVPRCCCGVVAVGSASGVVEARGSATRGQPARSAVGESPSGLRGGDGKAIEAQSAKHDGDGQT